MGGLNLDTLLEDDAVLAHGTSSKYLPAIASDGIKPRGKSGTDNWKHTVGSNPKSVYLTCAYALHFAAASNTVDSTTERLAIIEVIPANMNLAEQVKLHADEDAIEQSLRGKDDLPKEWDMKRRTIYYRTRAHNYPAVASLRALGTCGYRGVVPPRALGRVCYVTEEAFIRLVMEAFDPIIAIMNYHVMGGKYRSFQRWLFAPELVPAFSHISREGIDVAPRLLDV